MCIATMFTYFFAGNTFAPKSMYRGVPVQDFLQDAFIACYTRLAQ